MPTIDPTSLIKTALIALTLSTLGACSHQPREYSWSHHDSGEYLFAFDAEDCNGTAGGFSATLPDAQTAMNASPVFFDCMQNLGYFLVDPHTGERLTTAVVPEVVTTSDSQAAR